MPSGAPIIAIVGHVKGNAAATTAAKELGEALAKAGFRILVYGSNPDFLEAPVVTGYVASQSAVNGSIQVRYPLHQQKPAFPEQQTYPKLFDWRPDTSIDWEVSFYQSLNEVDGILLLGGGSSTMVAGLVSLGNRLAILSIAAFDGKAADVWKALRPGRDLPTSDEISMMAQPTWSSDLAERCVKTLTDQLARKEAEQKELRLQAMRAETKVAWHAVIALVLFLLSVAAVPFAWSNPNLSATTATWLLFISPLFAGVAGSTIRLVFDLRQGSAPLNRQSAITTAALGLIAGGVAGLLFITAQVSTLSTPGDSSKSTTMVTNANGEVSIGAATNPATISAAQASRLVPFGVVIGFLAGLTLDAVFRKLIASDVVDLSAVEAKKRS